MLPTMDQSIPFFGVGTPSTVQIVSSPVDEYHHIFRYSIVSKNNTSHGFIPVVVKRGGTVTPLMMYLFAKNGTSNPLILCHHRVRLSDGSFDRNDLSCSSISTSSQTIEVMSSDISQKSCLAYHRDIQTSRENSVNNGDF